MKIAIASAALLMCFAVACGGAVEPVGSAPQESTGSLANAPYQAPRETQAIGVAKCLRVVDYDATLCAPGERHEARWCDAEDREGPGDDCGTGAVYVSASVAIWCCAQAN